MPEPRSDAIFFDLDETLIDDDFNYESSIKATSEAISRASGRCLVKRPGRFRWSYT